MSPKEKVVETEERSEKTAPATAPELPVTFAKWFKVRGKERKFKPHWANGMRAFANTNEPHTLSEWDAIFRNY
jgi:hypothetical protein